MDLFLGVDGGGSKTLAIVVDESGRSLGVGLGGPGNFQGPGVEKARLAVQDSIEQALKQAGAELGNVRAAYFGMAGADRLADFKIVRDLIRPLMPASTRWGVENDSTIGIWAGTGDGIGVGVICGTGTNCLGFNEKGERVQVGGMGGLFGDYAGGSHIGYLAVARAMRGYEGRGEPTALYDTLCAHYGLTELIDLVEWQYEGKSMGLSGLVPLVFEVAEAGDKVAQNILIEVGRDMGITARAALRKLFADDDPVPIVLMGSVFQNPTYPLMYNTFVETVVETHPNVRPSILHCEPVFGAVYGALKQCGIDVSPEFQETLAKTFPGRPEAK